MSNGQVSYLAAFRKAAHQGERLADRARRRRHELIGTRKIWVVEIATQAQGVALHRFLEPPSVGDLMARLGADATVIGMRVEEVPGRRCFSEANAAD